MLLYLWRLHNMRKYVKKEIEIQTGECDFCGVDQKDLSYLYKCEVCGKDFCSKCGITYYAHMMCKECDSVFETYEDRIVELENEQDGALATIEELYEDKFYELEANKNDELYKREEFYQDKIGQLEEEWKAKAVENALRNKASI